MTREPSAFAVPDGVRLREAHAHIVWHGQAMDRVDLSACVDAEEALALMAARAESSPADRAVIGGGARPEAWAPAGWPALASFDDATGGRPGVMWCFDSHAAMANTAALSVAGIGRDAAASVGGTVVRDGDGAPTGVLLEAACAPLRGMESGDGSSIGRWLGLGLADFARHGYAEVHDLKTDAAMLSAMRAAPPSNMALRVYPLVEDLGRLADARSEWETDTLRLGGGKIFVDGTLNSRTAWMLDDWCDAASCAHARGMALASPRRIEDAVRACDRLGVPLAAHAIGDGAVRAVLDGIERAAPKTRGFRIEHCQFVHPDDVGRFAALGVIASVQPCHLLYDIEALRRATPDRLDRVLVLRSLIDAGCAPGELLMFGSDAPIARPDPGDSLRAAVARRRVGAAPENAIAPEQAVTMDEALASFRC